MFDRRLATKPEESWAARLYIRPLSHPITQVLLKTNITPNQVTVAFLIVMFVGALCQLDQRDRWVSIGGAFLLQLGIILDAVDGSIARVKKLYSVKGVYLDMVGHRLVHSVIYASVGIGLYLRDGAVTPVFLALFGVYGELSLTLLLYAKWRALVDYPALLTQELERVHSVPVDQRRRIRAGYTGTAWAPLARINHVLFGTDFAAILLLAVLGAAIADTLSWFLWFYATMQFIRASSLWLRQMWAPFTPDLPSSKPEVTTVSDPNSERAVNLDKAIFDAS
jgi:phosphatidylglycerophosphate synthase